MSIYDKASLVLIPSGTKTSKVYSQVPTNGDGDFTFSRSTAATRVNASGNIEKETQNLLLQSNTLDTTWYNSGTTETGGQSGYDGTNDAWEITKQTAGAYRYIAQAVTSSGVQTASFYAKAGSLSRIGILVGGGDNPYVSYDLSTGTILAQRASVIDSTMTDVGGGWYRCTMTYNVAISDINIYPDWDLANTGNLYLQDIQLEQGLVARDYIETTTTAIYGGITDNVPRLDYTDSSCPALLLEPQRTNLFPNSEYFSSWQVFRGSLTANSIISPEGFVNAYRYEENADTGQHFVRFQSISMTSGTDYTASVFAKAGELTSIILGSNSPSLWNPSTTTFNLSTGSVTSGGGTIEPMGNDWYRCIISGECVTTTSSAGLEITTSSGAGSSGDGLYIYGAMIEAGSYATSYIPTYGSAVTRNVDSCSKTGISSLIGQTEGTIYWEVQIDTPIATANEAILNIDGGFFGNTIYLSKSATGNITGEMYVSGGSSQSSFTLVGISAGSYKIAFAYAQNNTAMFVNGVQVGSTDTSCNVPATSRIQLGNTALGPSTDKTKQTLLFKTRLSNEELAALTTI